jgi:ATP-dependent Clp protease ATP-binding subunit ClpA
MLELFSLCAKRSIIHAQSATRWRCLPIVGTAQLVLGLLDVPQGVAANALINAGCDYKETQSLIDASSEKGTVTSGEMPLSSRAKQALAKAWAETRKDGMTRIYTGHILLGVLEQSDSTATLVLKNLKIDVENVANEIGLLFQDAGALAIEDQFEPNQLLPKEFVAQLSGDAAIILMFAEQAARMRGQNFLGTEHILEGLITHEPGTAAKLLLQQGATVEKVREYVDQFVDFKAYFIPRALILTPMARRVLENCHEHAQQRRSKTVDSEDMLFSLISAEGVALRLLELMNIDSKLLLQRLK